MALSELLAIVPPPHIATEAGTPSQVQGIEHWLGCSLPEDYYEYGRLYGSGRFCNGFLRVFNPFSRSYRPWIERRLSALSQAKARRDLERYEVFPAQSGLLPWGDDENGTLLCWMVNRVSPWPVVIRQQSGICEQWNLDFSSLLANALTNSIRVAAWHEPFSRDEWIFTPD